MPSSSSSSCPVALFDNSCIINSPCKVDFTFIADCTIPPPPPPIYDCDLPTCPPFVPPADEFCPDISPGNVTVSVRQQTRCDSSNSSESARGGIVVTQTIGCEFLIGLDLDIPIPAPPCPVFNPAKVTVTTAFNKSSCFTTKNKLEVTATAGDCENDDTCSFDIDLDLNIPIPAPRCPIINNEQTVTVKTGYANCVTGQNKLTVTTVEVLGDGCNTPDTCQFDFDLDLNIPIPAPRCPVINTEQTVTVKTGYANCVTGQNKLTVTTTDVPGDGCNTPDTCQFDFDLDLNIPIPAPRCPVINYQQPVNVNIGYANFITGQNKLTVTTTEIPGNGCNTPDTCQFDFTLDLNLPIPRPVCPTFPEQPVSVAVVYEDEPRPYQSRLYTTPVITPGDFDTPDTCQFDIKLDLVIPIPKIPCPIFRYANTVYSVGNNFAINDIRILPVSAVPNGRNPCEFEIYLFVTVPPPGGKLIAGKTTITRTVCDADPECTLIVSDKDVDGNQEIHAEIIWPTNPRVAGGAISLGSFGSGHIIVNNDDPCSPQLSATITLNTSACSTGGGGGGGSSSSDPDPPANCGADPCPPGCPPGTYCNPIPI